MNDILDDTVPTPAWCWAHDSIAQLFSDGSGCCIYSHVVEMGSMDCVLQQRRLVPVDALVLVRDADGNWPIWFRALVKAWWVKAQRSDFEGRWPRLFMEALAEAAEAAETVKGEK